MFSIQQIISLFLMLSMELGIAGCGANAKLQQSAGTSVPPANIQDTQEPSSDTSPEPEGEVAEGTEFYQGFRMDNVLHAPEGDIHYHIYIPDSYDGSESYALYLTLPGYVGLYFQGAGQNLYSENFAFAALQYNDKMIVAAPQLNDWGKTSAEQTIALTEYLLAHYNIDPDRVYANGYSGGGETMSRWNSQENRTPMSKTLSGKRAISEASPFDQWREVQFIGSVAPAAVVVGLDPAEYDLANLIPLHGGELEPVDQFLLQRCEKTLHARVVKAAMRAAHALPDGTEPGEHRPVLLAGVLAAVVGMQNQTFLVTIT